MSADSLYVDSLEVILPDAAARARAANRGMKPRAHIKLSLEGGDVHDLYVPARVGRLLSGSDTIALPAPVDEVEASIRELSGRVCFTLATELLSRRDHSRQELARKLSGYGFTLQQVDGALERASRHRFIDDKRFASYFIEERLRRGWGRRKIEAELTRRGVDPATVPGYPDRFFSADDDRERARALLVKKSVPESRGYEKLVRFLVSRGFSFDIARDAVRERLAEGC